MELSGKDLDMARAYEDNVTTWLKLKSRKDKPEKKASRSARSMEAPELVESAKTVDGARVSTRKRKPTEKAKVSD